jgi:hypothetical protein
MVVSLGKTCLSLWVSKHHGKREMMIEHGHQGGVAIDATFGTNEKKVIHYV